MPSKKKKKTKKKKKKKKKRNKQTNIKKNHFVSVVTLNIKNGE
jgi:hypothetical protein